MIRNGLFHILLADYLLRGVFAKCDLEIPSRPYQEKTIKVVKRAWVSHQLVSEVASILLEDVLMYEVVRYVPHTSPLDDLRALSLEEADVNFEVWEGGKGEELRKWIGDELAQVAGTHSMLGYDGIHTLRHTIEKFPEAEFYQYLQSPQLQWVFKGDTSKGEAAADPGNLCNLDAWNCTDFVWQPGPCKDQTAQCLGQVGLGQRFECQTPTKNIISKHQIPFESFLKGKFMEVQLEV